MGKKKLLFKNTFILNKNTHNNKLFTVLLICRVNKLQMHVYKTYYYDWQIIIVRSTGIESIILY